MSNQPQQKKIHNRYDCYEILSMFTTSAEQYMNKHFTAVRTRFYVKCVIGPLLAINAYLSHWGPWKWPSNFNLLIFSIILYYLGSFIYGKLDQVSKIKGPMFGQYIVDGQNKKYAMSFSDDKIDYILEQVDNSSKNYKKIEFCYPNYFTDEGLFLQQRFHKQLEGFLKGKAK